MKGDPAFQQEPVRRVFRSLGALFCLHLQDRWESKRRRATKSLAQTLCHVKTPEKAWNRWQDFSPGGDSAFASGQLKTALEVAKEALSMSLIDEWDKREFDFAMNLLHDIGAGKIGWPAEVRDVYLDAIRVLVFELGEIESVGTDLYVDNRSSQEFQLGSFDPGQRNLRATTVLAAQDTLVALGILEDGLNQAEAFQKGEKGSSGRIEIPVRYLVRASFEADGADLLYRMHNFLVSMYGEGPNAEEHTRRWVNRLLNSMKRQVTSGRFPAPRVPFL